MDTDLILKILGIIVSAIAGAAELSSRVPDEKLGRAAPFINMVARNTRHAQNG